MRAVEGGGNDAEIIVENALKAFRIIAGSKKSANAEEAFSLGFLQLPSTITASRKRLLAEAKQLCLKLASDFHPREENVIAAPVDALYSHLMQEAEYMAASEPHMDAHRLKTLALLAGVLSGKAALKIMEHQGIASPRADWDRLSERQVMDSSREAFMELVQMEGALEKIRNVLHRR
jgi:hypothetical protein